VAALGCRISGSKKPRFSTPLFHGLRGAHYRFRWDGQRIGRLYDFAADRDIDRNEIIAGSMAA
jgi:hypothetical protein